MIGFFPELYEDELVYSWIARYLVHSGYTSASDAYQDLYFNKNLRPSVELMNNMIDDAKTVMTKYMPINELILKHTLFPEYGRFIEPIKRERLLKEGDFTRGNWINNLMMPFSNGERYLMYCPLCAAEDRDTHGETYWHRKHQISNIKICVKHDVYLRSSNIVIERNLTRLKAAEIIIPRETIISKCEDKIIMKLAEYMVTVFDDKKYSHERIGRYINSQVPSKYLYSNGNRRMYALYADYADYYKTLDSSELMSMNSLCRLLGGHRGVYGYICQLGLLLSIPTEDLLNKGDEQNYDIFQRVSQITGEPIDRVHLVSYTNEDMELNIRFAGDISSNDNKDQEVFTKLSDISDWDIQIRIMLRKGKIHSCIRKYEYEDRSLESIMKVWKDLEKRITEDYLTAILGGGNTYSAEKVMGIIEESTYTRKKKDRLKEIFDAIQTYNDIDAFLQSAAKGDVVNISNRKSAMDYLRCLESLNINPVAHALGEDVIIPNIITVLG